MKGLAYADEPLHLGHLGHHIATESGQPAEELELSPALRIAMTDYASEVAKRAAEYARLRDKYVEVDARKLGGAPVIRGTRMPVRTLAELVESGESREVLRENHPHIPEEAYDIAVIWARGNPRRGRPNSSKPKSRSQPGRPAGGYGGHSRPAKGNVERLRGPSVASSGLWP